MKFYLCAFLIFICKLGFAGPWYTGALLAPSGHTVPKGHSNVETYGFYTDVQGQYDRKGRFRGRPGVKNTVLNPLFSHGLTDKVDIQYGVPYVFNQDHCMRSEGVGDVNVVLGYQVLEQKNALWRPDLKVTLQEILPSGTFEHLAPALNGTDSTGSGSYQTALNFNFQHTLFLRSDHYFRSRLSLGYVYSSEVLIHNNSVYGGNHTTAGKLSPGNLATIDLAGELSLTQNWVAVMEAFATTRQPATFKGYPGINAEGNLFCLGQPGRKLVSLAPAIEYNFTPSIGIIGGVWFSVDGRNTAKFSSMVLALNLYF